MIVEGYKYFRWLSLDIVLGAICFLAFLGKFYDVSIPFNVHLALGSAIWIIYNVDHLIDAFKSSDTERRAFHFRYWREITCVLGLVLVGALINIYFLPVSIIRNGAILSAVCVGYLLTVFFFRALWLKELVVAVGYAFGIFLAPISIKGAISFIDIFLAIQLASVALINLLIFSIFDSKADAESGFGSLPNKIGIGRTSHLLKGLFVVSLTGCAMGGIQFPELVWIELTFAIITILLAMIHLRPLYFAGHERFRLFGDAVFYTPLFFIFIQ